MAFQRARNDEQKMVRLNQIMDAMTDLMHELPFNKITMKKLSECLCFTRNNLYQYVKSPNEVVLLILQRDFCKWADELSTALNQLPTTADLNQFCKTWVNVAIKYPMILHWFPLLGEIIEQDVRLEKLVCFKKSFFEDIDKIKHHITTTKFGLNIPQANNLIYFHLRVLSQLFHLYHLSSIQIEAMEATGHPLPQDSFKDQAELELKIYINGLKATL